MTEKRYSHDAIVIVDHLKKDLIYIDGKEDLLELAEYVDKLQEENEQLKHFIQELTTKGTGKIHLADGYSYSVSAVLTNWKGDVE